MADTSSLQIKIDLKMGRTLIKATVDVVSTFIAGSMMADNEGHSPDYADGWNAACEYLSKVLPAATEEYAKKFPPDDLPPTDAQEHSAVMNAIRGEG